MRQKLLHCISVVQVLEEVWLLQEEVRLKVIIFLWCWWSSRNKVNSGDSFPTCDEIIYLVNCCVNDFMELLHPSKVARSQSPPSKWSPPSAELLKINTDGSFCAETRTGGWGAIVRDHQGRPLMAAAGRLQNLEDALQAEAMACVQVLKKANGLVMGRIILESVARNLCQALKEEELDSGINASIIRETRELLFLQFDVTCIA